MEEKVSGPLWEGRRSREYGPSPILEVKTRNPIGRSELTLIRSKRCELKHEGAHGQIRLVDTRILWSSRLAGT